MKKDVMNPLTWNSDQWIDAFLGLIVGAFAFAMTMFVIIIFH